MTDEAMIAELQGLLEKATPGPWTWEQDRLGGYALYSGRTATYHGLNLLGRMDPDGDGEANLSLIIALRNAAPRLLELAQRGMQMEAKETPMPGFDPDDYPLFPSEAKS